ncbi:hypothetical protein GALMADRAFT_143404 [Galerina marginata CBS 339.88]|uniref:Uncharacterized protein n=1 Tax=Galerina marginata (strain CBS 339.88) TaxID=685588 RepID=A0A067SMB3_GALM3|nr:hypothetical protein GALMADRAFT_143404 [Galerina marginata CBS 339.88]
MKAPKSGPDGKTKSQRFLAKNRARLNAENALRRKKKRAEERSRKNQRLPAAVSPLQTMGVVEDYRSSSPTSNDQGASPAIAESSADGSFTDDPDFSSSSSSRSSSPDGLSELLMECSIFDEAALDFEKKCGRVQAFYDERYNLFSGWTSDRPFEKSGVLEKCLILTKEGVKLIDSGRKLLEKLSHRIQQVFEEWRGVTNALIYIGGNLYVLERMQLAFHNSVKAGP